jgi:hypothetical protein
MKKHPFLDIDLKPIQDALGPDIELPDLPPGPLGRFRLVQVLQNRFGNDFKTIGSARKALQHFDMESKMMRKFMEVKLDLGGENG